MYKPFLGASPPALLTTLVTKIRSPQTIGDDHPEPGTSTFQITFSVADHLSGSAGSSTTPVDPGPRNSGQLSPADNGNIAIAIQSTNLIPRSPFPDSKLESRASRAHAPTR